MTSPPDVVILGCERSGSTWLTNIFDSHPAVECYMEPWAPYAGLFPGFPDRHVYVSAPSDLLLATTMAHWEAVRSAKFPGLYRPGRRTWTKCADAAVGRLHTTAARVARAPQPEWLRRFELLNLNQSDVPMRAQPRKVFPTVHVLKELRLNMKVALLTRLWPDAVYLVPIRHPGAQLSSILSRFERGGLQELRTSLPAFTSLILGDPRFADYRPAAAPASGDKTLLGALALWWLVNYDMVLTDLGKSGAVFHVVHHERLSAAPHEVTAELFHRCRIPPVPATAQYVTASSTTPGTSRSPTDTTRDSKRHSSRTIAKAQPNVTAAVEELAETLRQSRMAPAITAYLTELA